MAAEGMADEQKITQLATWSSRYRAGNRHRFAMKPYQSILHSDPCHAAVLPFV